MCCQEFSKELREHNVFLCSNKYKIQQLPDGKYVVVMVLSMENLLMNAYHWQQTGQYMFICIDASYCCMFEGYRLLVVKIVITEKIQGLHTKVTRCNNDG